MKKIFTIVGFGILSLTVLIFIGLGVTHYMSTRLNVSNERLNAREEERSSVEDHWIAYHDRNKNDPANVGSDFGLTIEKVTVTRSSGELEWSDTRGQEGTVNFYLNTDDSVTISERRSDLPEHADYRGRFLKAIEEALN
ncbi:MAG: hypothetical protein ABS873_02015 [Alkalibacterium sp.]